MSCLISARESELVRCLFIRKRRFKLRLPFGVLRKSQARLGFAQRLQIDHFARQIEHCFLDFSFLRLPAGAPQFRQLRIGAGATDIFLHQVDLRCRNIDARALAEFEDEVFLGLAVLFEHVHAAKTGNAMTDVNDQIALVQIEEAIDGPRFQLTARQKGARLFAME